MANKHLSAPFIPETDKSRQAAELHKCDRKGCSELIHVVVSSEIKVKPRRHLNLTWYDILRCLDAD